MSLNLPLPHTCQALIKASNVQRNCQYIAVCGERHDKDKNLETLKAFILKLFIGSLEDDQRVFLCLSQ